MAEISDERGILRQNLLDAGCGAGIARRCMEMAEQGKWEELLSLLAKHKTALLETVHAGQRQIDCLDFLTYQIERKNISL